MKKFWHYLQKTLGRTDIWSGGTIYMRRWLFPQPWFKWANDLPGLRLHNIKHSDPDTE